MRRAGWLLATALLLAAPAAQAGYQEAIFAYNKGDFAAARSQLEAIADSDPRALVALGVMAARGDGMEANLSRAASWFSRAAAAGDANGEYHLGRLLYTGKGVPADKVRAAAMFGQAAAQSHVGATQALSLMLETGDGVPADPKRAFELALSNAEAGVPRDQYRAARMLAEGRGTEVDPGRAYFYVSLAARTGLQDAEAMREAFAAKLTEAQLAEQRQQLIDWRPTGQK